MTAAHRERPDGCALYARVSSDAQDVDLSISAQLKALRRHAANEGWAIVKEYVDEAKSARTDRRPAFKEMLADALDGWFSRILVWKFSRFARSRRDGIVYKSMLRRISETRTHRLVVFTGAKSGTSGMFSTSISEVTGKK